MEARLTDRQREVLEFIQAFSEAHGVPPTVREIGGRFHVTPRAAFDHLRALERKGYLRRRSTEGRTSRALTLVVPPAKRYEVPILGRIAAGTPLLAEENRDGTLPLDPAWVGGRGDDVFGLRVRGESMINAHIVEGDLVLVRRQDHAQPGDIVVALVDGEATVKRFARDAHAVLLRPEHPTMGPIIIREGEKDLRILGKVVGLVRGL
jgi:repressor LexA